MDRETFAKYISENLAISQKKATKIIDDFTSNISQAIFEGHVVSLDDFGNFIPNLKVLSPKDSVIKSGISPLFIPGTKLKESNINQM